MELFRGGLCKSTLKFYFFWARLKRLLQAHKKKLVRDSYSASKSSLFLIKTGLLVVQRGLVLPRARKSSGSGLIIYQSSGSGLFGFLTKSNVRVRVQDFGFIGFLGFQYAVFIAFLCDNFVRNFHFQMIFFFKIFSNSILM